MHERDYAEFKAIAEKLALVAIVDANPDNWDASGLTPGAMSQAQRGDAYWCRKLASQTLSVLSKVMNVVGMIERASRAGELPDDPANADAARLHKEINSARRKAGRMLKLVHSRPNVAA
jgi:hypothetical protein